MQNLHPHERELLEKLKAEFKGKSSNVTFSALYLDNLLENGDCRFPLLAADSNAVPGSQGPNKAERRLAVNEAFVPTRLKMVMKLVTGASGSENHAQAIGYTYPNTSVFVSDTGFVNSDLWAVWNGFLSMRYQETVYEPAIESARFLNVPELQTGEKTVNNAATPITTTRTAADAHDPSHGEVFLQSYPLLKGNVSHDIVLRIPNASNLKMKHTTANTQIFLRLIMRGFVIQGIAG